MVMPKRLGQPQVFIGVDVSEQQLDAHLLPGNESLGLTHDARGIGRLVAWLASKAGPFVVGEATGGLEQRLARSLDQAGIVMAVVNHRAQQARRSVHAMAGASRRRRGRSVTLPALPGCWRSMPSGGLRPTRGTDRLDARCLALFAERMRPEPRAARTPEDGALAAIVLRRRQLVLIREAERNRRRRAGDPVLMGSLDAHLAWLGTEIERLDAAIAEQIERTESHRSRARLLASVPGLGHVSIAGLLALLPELGGLDGKAVASLAGLAPFARDSGLMKGHRTIWAVAPRSAPGSTTNAPLVVEQAHGSAIDLRDLERIARIEAYLDAKMQRLPTLLQQTRRAQPPATSAS